MDYTEYLQDYIDSYENMDSAIDGMLDDVNIKEMKDFINEMKKEFENTFAEEYQNKVDELEEIGQEEYENEYEERCHEYWSDQF
jgi:hypothetical protein